MQNGDNANSLVGKSSVGKSSTGRSPAGQAILAELENNAERQVTTYAPGGNIVWRRWGQGPACVLLHGGYGSWRHWARNINQLAKSRTVLVPDLPGLGDSSNISERETLPDIAAYVTAGVFDLGFTPSAIDVVGFSFGSMVAGCIAAQTVVRSLTLVGPSGLNVPRAPVKLERAPPEISTTDYRALQRRNLAALMIANPQNIDELAIDIQIINLEHARFKSRRFAPEAPLVTAMSASKAQRVVAIWGEKDAVAAGTLIQRQDQLKSLHTGVHIKTIPGAGHWVAYEAAEGFNRVLIEGLG